MTFQNGPGRALQGTTCVRRGSRVAGLGLVVLAGLCGCGGGENWLPEIKDPAYPVTGKVILPGGQPLNGGRVEFYPVEEPGLLAFGEIKTDGTFELQTRQPGDGAIPGAYKVRILVPEKKEYSRLARYRDEDGSKLVARVASKPTVLAPFQLK